ncbi:disease resistance protein RPM1-like [Castanea sativa]|uniref:disease resistance protein RPM1-like n=1 Tax=Castanea sativa TaxID=21020 RepID=UPI003F64B51B
MHDLLRALALSISFKEKFGCVHDGREEMKECKARRITIHKIDGELKSFTGIQAPSNIAQLKNLQAVCSIATNDDLIRQIRSMTQLTTFGISNVKAANEMDLFISIQNMTHLKNMSVKVANEEETLQMDALSSPPPNIQKVFLTGNLEKVPQWFRSLQSLTFLYMHWSKLEEDLLTHIAALHHLGRLSLTNAYVRKQLYFSTSFLKLTELWIRNFLQLNEIIIEKGVMPNLKYLYIGSCMELKNVLMGIEYLKNLQQLNLESVLVELENRICNVDFLKVQHIPMIYI